MRKSNLKIDLNSSFAIRQLHRFVQSKHTQNETPHTDFKKREVEV